MAGLHLTPRFTFDRRDAPGRARAFELPGGVFNATPPRILFGAGSLGELPRVLGELGARRALVVSTPGRRGLAERAVALLGDACAGLLPEAISQVPIESAIRGRERFRAAGADALVSIGGGASVGLGKAIGLELGCPIVAVPTTYSGSEMTGFCGITIDGVKRMHTSLDMLADCVIYDPELSVTLPVETSAASAFNALAHCVDAIYVPTAAPAMIAAAFDGARAIVDALPRVVARPDDLDARADLLHGGMLGGAALTGGFALQHGLAHTLGGSFGVPHGHAHAIVLPHVAHHNARHAPAPLARMASTLGTDALGATLFDLLVTCGLPTSLRAFGLDDAIVERCAAITVETDNGLNPGRVTHEAVAAMVRDMLDGRRPGAAG
ncbi:MAG: maleylacetate reductase [Burkholderiaceae bacterium]|jgi:alcohol dehydrogenase class IV|nr:maleylacetate reductase [Burkholderiales bacterium]MCZ8102005.1 maleylacetate reductase [Burkholderiales bacterium]MCZ8337203.1 maleylacetate reductase [Burkholderiaceae bacterium]